MSHTLLFLPKKNPQVFCVGLILCSHGGDTATRDGCACGLVCVCTEADRAHEEVMVGGDRSPLLSVHVSVRALDE